MNFSFLLGVHCGCSGKRTWVQGSEIIVNLRPLVVLTDRRWTKACGSATLLLALNFFLSLFPCD